MPMGKGWVKIPRFAEPGIYLNCCHCIQGRELTQLQKGNQDDTSTQCAFCLLNFLLFDL